MLAELRWGSEGQRFGGVAGDLIRHRGGRASEVGPHTPTGSVNGGILLGIFVLCAHPG